MHTIDRAQAQIAIFWIQCIKIFHPGPHNSLNSVHYGPIKSFVRAILASFNTGAIWSVGLSSESSWRRCGKSRCGIARKRCSQSSLRLWRVGATCRPGQIKGRGGRSATVVITAGKPKQPLVAMLSLAHKEGLPIIDLRQISPTSFEIPLSTILLVL